MNVSGVDAQIVVVGSKATTLNLDFSGAANTGNFEITNGTAEGDNTLTALKTITVSGDQHANFTKEIRMDRTDISSFLRKYATEPGNDGYAGLEHRGLFINLQIDERLGSLSLYASLGSLPDPAPAEMIEHLLEVNLLGAATGGGHIGLYLPLRTLVYSRRVELGPQEPERLEELLDAFADQAFYWIENLHSIHQEKVKEISLATIMFKEQMLWG